VHRLGIEFGRERDDIFPRYMTGTETAEGTKREIFKKQRKLQS